MLELDDVQRAAEVLKGIAHRTPVLTSHTLDEEVGGAVFLKCENFQRTGSFKFRGAFNKILSLREAERKSGVCTISSGNHSQAVALAAKILGVPAAILMPADAPPGKLAATRAYGADVTLYDRYSIPQFEAGRKFREQTGLAFVSSHDDPAISAGAGTAALELMEEIGEVDVLFAPIGGGGGIAGYSTVVKALYPNALVIGAEPAASRIATRSLETGRRVSIEVPKTIADGQQLTILGEFPFSVMQQRVDEVIAVEDDEIVESISFLLNRVKIVAEPSGAIALAALRKYGDLGGRRAGVIVSGGNVESGRLFSLISESSSSSR